MLYTANHCVTASPSIDHKTKRKRTFNIWERERIHRLNAHFFTPTFLIQRSRCRCILAKDGDYLFSWREHRFCLSWSTNTIKMLTNAILLQLTAEIPPSFIYGARSNKNLIIAEHCIASFTFYSLISVRVEGTFVLNHACRSMFSCFSLNQEAMWKETMWDLNHVFFIIFSCNMVKDMYEFVFI